MPQTAGFLGLFRRKKRKLEPRRGSETSLAELFANEAPQPALGGAEALPGFRATAADQLDRRRSDHFTKLRMQLRSAFTPSQPVSQRRMFAGRVELFETMITSIEDQRLHLVIYGERGIGKTSLLHMLAQAAREARYITLYSSCGAASSFEDTFHAAAAEIPLLFHKNYGPTSEDAEAGKTFADLLPERFSPRQFADLCASIVGTRILIVLDEFDRSQSSEFRRDLAELIKFLSDRSVRVQLVIGGVAADLAELIEHIPSIRRNILAVRVPHMTDLEVGQLVAAGANASGLNFTVGANQPIIRLACGWPYLASSLSQLSGLHAIDAQRVEVLREDVLAASDQTINDFRSRLPHRITTQIDRLQAEGLGDLLTLLAEAALNSGREFSVAEFEAKAPDAAHASAAKRLAEQLSEDQMILIGTGEAGRRRYAFAEDSLAPYLWFSGAKTRLESNKLAPHRATTG